jgi:L-alanine-DL-glutamate epimerase-like enolase superfamily enzyme
VVEVTPKGTIKVPNTPGLGYAVNRDFVEKLTVRRNIWIAGRAAK